jgi:hypothetical protein
MVACPIFGLPSILIDRTIPEGNPQDIFQPVIPLGYLVVDSAVKPAVDARPHPQEVNYTLGNFIKFYQVSSYSSP